MPLEIVHRAAPCRRVPVTSTLDRMHSPAIITAMLLGTVGVPLAALFLLTFLVSLAFRRIRAFAAKLLGWSFLTAAVAGLLFWFWARAGLPKPYHYQAAASTLPFWFGSSGFVLFVRYVLASRERS